jgi:hypothetical protein
MNTEYCGLPTRRRHGKSALAALRRLCLAALLGVGAMAGGSSAAHADALPCVPTGSSGCDLAPPAGPGPVVRPGDMIQTKEGRCSIGLTGHIGLARYAVTDGHCWEPGAVVWNATGTRIGVFEAGQEDGTQEGDPLGYGLIRLDPNVTPTGMFRDHLIESVDTAPPVGAPICKVGERTGWTCGVLLHATDDDVIIGGMRNDDGDSGSLVYRTTPDGQAAFVGLLQGSLADNSGTDVEPAAELFAELNAYAASKHATFQFYGL